MTPSSKNFDKILEQSQNSQIDHLKVLRKLEVLRWTYLTVQTSRSFRATGHDLFDRPSCLPTVSGEFATCPKTVRSVKSSARFGPRRLAIASATFLGDEQSSSLCMSSSSSIASMPSNWPDASMLESEHDVGHGCNGSLGSCCAFTGTFVDVQEDFTPHLKPIFSLRHSSPESTTVPSRNVNEKLWRCSATGRGHLGS